MPRKVGTPMIMTNLQGVADALVRRARRQGYVVPRDARQELADAGLPDDLWREALALAQPALSFRQGRYYYATRPRPGVGHRKQRALQRTLRDMIRRYKSEAAQLERRRHGRIDFIQPVKVV